MLYHIKCKFIAYRKQKLHKGAGCEWVARVEKEKHIENDCVVLEKKYKNMSKRLMNSIRASWM